MLKTARVLVLLAAAALVTTSASVAAGQADKKSPSVEGAWTLNVDGGPHGATAMGLTLKQDKDKVTGSFSSPHGDLPVQGTFANHKLDLATPPDASVQVTFSGSLKDDDTLSGYVSTEMGDMPFTGTRVKDGK